MASHFILDDRVRIYQRENSSVWQAQARFEGKKFRVSTKTASITEAKEFAENWYFDLRGRSQNGRLVKGKTFAEATAQHPHLVYFDRTRKIVNFIS